MKRKQSTLAGFVKSDIEREHHDDDKKSKSAKPSSEGTAPSTADAKDVKPLLLFAPGAGAPSTHPWMQEWANRLGSLGIVELMDYEYMKNGRKMPDPHAKLVACHQEALNAAKLKHQNNESEQKQRPVVLVGKSMGSRMGCHVAAEQPQDIAAVVCFGYPLVGQNGAKRDEVLYQLRVPILLIQGTRDSLCPLKELEELKVRLKMKAPNELFVVDTGDHSLQVLKKGAKKSQQQVDAEILAAVRTFIRKHVK